MWVWKAFFLAGAILASGLTHADDSPSTVAIGMSLGFPYAPEFSLIVRPVQHFYIGPQISNLFGYGLSSHNSLATLLAIEIGGMIGGEWVLGNDEGFVIELNAAYVLPYGYESLASDPPINSPEEGWLVGGQVGWFVRYADISWQIKLGVTYLDWLLADEIAKKIYIDYYWIPTIKLTAFFDL